MVYYNRIVKVEEKSNSNVTKSLVYLTRDYSIGKPQKSEILLYLISLETGFPTSQSHLKGDVLFAMMTSLDFPCLNDFNDCFRPSTHFPDFMTRANLVLMLSKAFFYKYKFFFNNLC